MIELNDRTKHDFLSREWVQKLLDAGVDMSDAKYNLFYNSIFQKDKNRIFIDLKTSENYVEIGKFQNCMPTYTVSELLYKLHEWIYPTIDGKEFSGGLKMLKDAPCYIFYYDLKTKDYNPLKFSHDQPEEWDESFMGECETPIESLASLLLQCHTRDIGLKRKDTGDIRDKYERY